MPVLWLIGALVWTLLVLRVVGVRATLSERTLLTYLALGALLAVAVAPLLASLVNPYDETQAAFGRFVLTAGRLALLLAPVAYALHARQTERALSVADAFLLAFMVGFGFDLLGAVVAASAASERLRAISFVPPSEVDAASDLTAAGFGYWAGLVALVYAAARRFLRRPGPISAITAVVFLLVALQAAALATGERPTGLLGLILTLTFEGAPTATLVLIAVVALSVLESVWVARLTSGDDGPETPILAEWQARLAGLGSGGLAEYARVGDEFGRRRQERLVQAEKTADGQQARSPAAQLGLPAPPMATEPFSERHDDDPPTPRPTPRPMQGGALDTLEDPAERPAPPSPWFWRHVGVVQAVCALGLAVVLLLPMLPASASDRIWDFPPLSFELRQPPLTIVNALLVLVLVWWYVVAAVRAASDTPDPLVRYVGERAILLAALASVVVVVLGVRNTFLYPFFSLVAIHTGVGLPSHEVYEAQTLLLVLAIAVASLTLNRAAAWRRAPLPERRASAVHNAVTLLAVLLGAWAIVACYLPLLEAIHEFLGSLLYNLFGQRGNLAGAILMILLSAALAYLAIRLLRPLAGRVEAFFVDRAVP